MDTSAGRASATAGYVLIVEPLYPTALCGGSPLFVDGPRLPLWLRQARRPRLGFGGIANAEIRAIRVVKRQGAHARFRIHHESFRQLNANFFGLQQLPHSRLVFEVRASWIAEAVAFPPIT